jgi:hypothetical protein
VRKSQRLRVAIAANGAVGLEKYDAAIEAVQK